MALPSNGLHIFSLHVIIIGRLQLWLSVNTTTVEYLYTVLCEICNEPVKAFQPACDKLLVKEKLAS
jgi:hypothetical protein